MIQTIRKELTLNDRREIVWQAITDSAVLAEWMFPNNFEPRVGHKFTFQVPGKPEVKFDGLTVYCEVLICEAPSLLVFTWSAGGVVVNTQVSFKLEADGENTRLVFEHSGFDTSLPYGMQAFKGADYGWTGMFDKLKQVIAQKH